MRNIHIDLLQDYVDDELGARERLKLAKHLGANAQDRARVEAYQAQRDELLRLYNDKLHEAIPGSIQELIDLAPVATQSSQDVEGRGSSLPARQHNLHESDSHAMNELVGTLITQAVQSYNYYAGERGQPPLFEGERLQEFCDWFECQTSVRLVTPRLDEFGFSVLHARLLPWAPGAAGQVLYRDATGRLLATYFHVFHRSPGSKAPVQPVCTEQDRLSIYYWQYQAVYYAMVASMSQRELMRIAQAITH